MNDIPKYSLVEIERRWLVEVSAIDNLDHRPYREIHDLYISGSRLRLRRVAGPATEVIFKLGKKYGKRTSLSEPITNLYLTESEYRSFSGLPGTHTRKRRYALADGTLDIYLEPNSGLAVFEVEFDDERAAEAYRPPLFVTREITGDSEFSGISLAESRETA